MTAITDIQTHSLTRADAGDPTTQRLILAAAWTQDGRKLQASAEASRFVNGVARPFEQVQNECLSMLVKSVLDTALQAADKDKHPPADEKPAA